MNHISVSKDTAVAFSMILCMVMFMTLGLTAPLQAQTTQPTVNLNPESASQPAQTQPKWTAQMNRFATIDLKSPPPANPVVFIGASSFTLWSSLEPTFKEFNALNRAFGGSRLEDLINHLDQIVIRYKPKAVVIWGGNSDITSGKSVDEVFATYRTLLEKIHGAVPDTQIFCLSIIPAPSRVKNIEKLDQVSNLLRDYASAHPHVHYIDARFVLSDPGHNPDPANYRSDQLHPNETGYAKLAPEIKKALHAVLDEKPSAK